MYERITITTYIPVDIIGVAFREHKTPSTPAWVPGDVYPRTKVEFDLGT